MSIHWLPSPKFQKRLQGFTLAELLIALLILGEIATFTIPKILSSQQNGTKKMIFRETLATLEQIVYLKIYIGGDTTSSSTDILLDNLNAVKVCKTNAMTQGCYQYGGAFPGALLPNGAAIGNVDGWTSWSIAGCKVDGVFVDWNADTGPNVVGDDILPIIINVSNQMCNDVPPQKLRATTYWGDVSTVSLFGWVWQ